MHYSHFRKKRSAIQRNPTRPSSIHSDHVYEEVNEEMIRNLDEEDISKYENNKVLNTVNKENEKLHPKVNSSYELQDLAQVSNQLLKIMPDVCGNEKNINLKDSDQNIARDDTILCINDIYVSADEKIENE